jgi:D-aspartate ligase
VLLTQAAFYGTLGAVRAYGRAGLEVTVADSDPRAPACWSRFAAHRESCPPESQPEAFIAWLDDFGARRPGHVLIATSDETAWLYATFRERLSRRFRLYQPDADAVFGLLDKRRLAGHARAVGLATPPTWFPETVADVEAVAREASFPVLLKPVTEILSERHIKGARVTSAAALVSSWRRFSRHRYAPLLTQRHPEVARPMIQAWLPEAEQGIESVSGFIDETGERVVMRGSRKVLQRPRRIGVGVCFEAMPVDPALADGLRRLCRRVGAFGVFEAEFIRVGGAAHLIDFNPRFFGQMGFDIARGVNLPLLMYAAALGDDALLQRTLDDAGRAGEALEWRFVHRLAARSMLRAQRLTAAASREEVARWRRWMAGARRRTADPLLDWDDWRPAAVDVATSAARALRHPRAWLRTIALNRG